MRWNSNYEANDSLYFRVFLNGKIDSTCKRPLVKGNVMCTIEHLIPNTMYEVEVKICPSDEENPKNCEQSLGPRSVSTYPQAPETFTAEAVDGERIKFSWSMPKQTLQNLRVYTSAMAANSTSVKDVSADVNSTIVNGLKPLTEYTATLFVLNTYSNIQVECEKVVKVHTPGNSLPEEDDDTSSGESLPVEDDDTSSGECFKFAHAGLLFSVIFTQKVLRL